MQYVPRSAHGRRRAVARRPAGLQEKRDRSTATQVLFCTTRSGPTSSARETPSLPSMPVCSRQKPWAHVPRAPKPIQQALGSCGLSAPPQYNSLQESLGMSHPKGTLCAIHAPPTAGCLCAPGRKAPCHITVPRSRSAGRARRVPGQQERAKSGASPTTRHQRTTCTLAAQLRLESHAPPTRCHAVHRAAR